MCDDAPEAMSEAVGKEGRHPLVGRTVTLEFLDGHTQEIAVGKKRDLSKVGLGDSVRIQLTEAVAIEVVKP